MLIDEKAIEFCNDPIMAMIAEINGNDSGTKRLQKGIYQIGDFNGNHRLPRGEYEDYPELRNGDDYFGSYGVCDGVENLLEKAKFLNDENRKFVVTLTSVKKSNQESEGGWRWHKWGEYIGNHEPQHEYLYDEEGIEEVFFYHIFEKK